MLSIIREIEEEQLKKNIPLFRSGDTIEVKVWVIESFEGTVIGIKNRHLNSSFTVRKISNGEGIERVFQTHSHSIDQIIIKRKGLVRKAKLYYLRTRTGKSARIKERLN